MRQATKAPLPQGLHRLGSAPECLARLEERLEAAEDPAPAAAGTLALALALAGEQRRQPGCSLDVVDNRELRRAAAALLDLVREAGEALRRRLRVHEHPPCLKSRRRRARRSGRVGTPSRASPPRRG